MNSPELDQLDTTYPMVGSDVIDTVRHAGTNVYINGAQHFGGVREEVWNFWVGGHQPAQKWLKDRMGTRLTDEELQHYQRLVKSISCTLSLMTEIG